MDHPEQKDALYGLKNEKLKFKNFKIYNLILVSGEKHAHLN